MIDPLERRKELGLNQSDFYSVLGVSQECGSRWERGERGMSQPVEKLLYLLTTPRKEAAIAELNSLRRRMGL